MLGDNAFSSWSRIFAGGVCFALLFELPLVLADYLLEGTVGLRWSTLVFGMAAFLGYATVGGIIMKSSRSMDLP